MPADPLNPPSAESEAVFHSLVRMWGLLRQAQDPHFARFGISISQWGILRVLQRAEAKGEVGLPLKEVSARMLIQPPSVTGVVDRLEREGLVKRASSDKDLRVRRLTLTTAGRQLMARALVGHAERIDSMFEVLDRGEQATLLQLLKKLEAHLGTQVLRSTAPPPSQSGSNQPLTHNS